MPYAPLIPNIDRICAAICLIAVAVVVTAQPAWACSTPVFRYALERWPADVLEVVVLHDEPLTGEQREQIDRLRRAATTATDDAADASVANLSVRVMRVSDGVDDTDAPWVHDDADGPLPAMVLRFAPAGEKQGVAWSGALNKDNVDALLDSPARQEIATRLLAGDSAVWVMVDSGNDDRDSAAEARLRGMFDRLKRSLDIDLLEDVPTADSPAEAPPLDVRFTLVRIKRSDPTERILRDMLIASEDDLKDYADQPIAFAVFGRGRVLYSLVGDGITDTNVGEACAFITGPCSCEVKADNPGVDLLMTADWEAFTRGTLAEPISAPPLVGMTVGQADAAQPAATTQPSDAGSDAAPTTDHATPPVLMVADSASSAQASTNRLQLIVGALAAGLALLAVTFIMLRRSEA